MQQNFKFLYLSTFILPFVALSSSDSFLVLWIVMEVQMIMFSSIIWLQYTNKGFLLSYTIIQVISGLFLLVLWSFQNLSYSYELSSLFINIVLFFKMGAFPFQNWGLNFIKKLNYMDLFFFLTSMKFFPFYFILHSNHFITLLFISINFIGSLFYLFYLNSYKSIIFLSSTVSSMFFLVILLNLGQMTSFFFLMYYLVFLYFLLKELHNADWEFVFSGKYVMNMIFAFFFVFSLAGVPFSVGFIMKISILKVYFSTMLSNLFYFFIYMTSLVFSFFYVKILFFIFIVLGDLWNSQHSFKMSHTMQAFSISFILYVPFILSLIYFSWYSSLF